jgi:hypothetical protein
MRRVARHPSGYNPRVRRFNAGSELDPPSGSGLPALDDAEWMRQALGCASEA